MHYSFNMTKNISALLEKQKFEIKSMYDQKFVSRDVDLDPRVLNENLIKVITGPRRSGNFFLLYNC